MSILATAATLVCYAAYLNQAAVSDADRELFLLLLPLLWICALLLPAPLGAFGAVSGAVLWSGVLVWLPPQGEVGRTARRGLLRTWFVLALAALLYQVACELEKRPASVADYVLL